MIRDKEIERLIKYAQALGHKVIFSNKRNPSTSAEWLPDGSQITIYTEKNTSKIETILTLIHEICHGLDFVYKHNRQLDEKFEEAAPDDDEEQISKKRRKVVLNSEIDATKYWEKVYKETNLLFPIYKLHAQKEIDVWHFEFYYETGKFPTSKESRKKRKEVFAKHRKIKYE